MTEAESLRICIASYARDIADQIDRARSAFLQAAEEECTCYVNPEGPCSGCDRFIEADRILSSIADDIDLYFPIET